MERELDDDTHCCCGCCPSLRAGVTALAVLTWVGCFKTSGLRVSADETVEETEMGAEIFKNLHACVIGSMTHVFVVAVLVRCDKPIMQTGDEVYPTICFEIYNWFGVSCLIQGFTAIAVSAALIVGILKYLADLLVPYFVVMIANGSAFIVIGGLLTFSQGSQHRVYGTFQIQWGVLVIYFSWLVRRYRRELIYKQANVLTVSTSQTGSELSAQLQNGEYSQFDNQHEPAAIRPLPNYPLPSITTNNQRVSPRSASHPHQGIISTPRRNSQPGIYLKPTAIPRLGIYPQPNPNQHPIIYRPSDFLRPGYMQSVPTSRSGINASTQPTNPIQLGNPTQSGGYTQFGNNLQSGTNWHPGSASNLETNPVSNNQQPNASSPISNTVHLDISPDTNPSSGSLTPPDDNP